MDGKSLTATTPDRRPGMVKAASRTSNPVTPPADGGILPQQVLTLRTLESPTCCRSSRPSGLRRRSSRNPPERRAEWLRTHEQTYHRGRQPRSPDCRRPNPEPVCPAARSKGGTRAQLHFLYPKISSRLSNPEPRVSTTVGTLRISFSQSFFSYLPDKRFDWLQDSAARVLLAPEPGRQLIGADQLELPSAVAVPRSLCR